MTTTDAVLFQLPGQAREDKGLIDETVAELNAIVDRGGLATMRQLARIVLDRMFRDDADAFLRDEDSHASYRALLRHPDLRVSRTGLWYAVAIDKASQALGADGERLTAAHLKRLVHIANAEDRAALAAQAVRGGWNVETLEAAIAKRTPPRPVDAPRLGRPPQPLPVKRLAKVERALAALGAETAGAAELDAEAAQALLARAEAAQQALASWVAALRSRVAG